MASRPRGFLAPTGDTEHCPRLGLPPGRGDELAKDRLRRQGSFQGTEQERETAQQEDLPLRGRPANARAITSLAGAEGTRARTGAGLTASHGADGQGRGRRGARQEGRVSTADDDAATPGRTLSLLVLGCRLWTHRGHSPGEVTEA